MTLCAATVQAAFFCSTAECFVHLRARVQPAATAGTGSAATTSTLDQLRETLRIEKCKAAVIDLLVRKTPRIDEQVRFPGIGCQRVCAALWSVPSW